MKQILKFVRPYSGKVVKGFLFKLVATMFDLLIPWGMTFMFGTIVKMEDVRMIVLWGVVLLLFAACDFLFNIIANRTASLVSRNATERIRLELFAKINYMSTEQQEDFTSASLISRLTTDTYNVHQFLGMIQRMGVRQPLVVIGTLVITFFMDWKLTLVMLAMMPIMGIAVFLFTKYGHPMFEKVQTALDRFVQIVREDVNGIRVIKALSKNHYERERFEKVNRDVVEKNEKATLVMGGMHPLVRIILNVGLALVIYFGAKFITGGESAPETVLGFMTYVTMILNAILFISRLFLMYTRASVSARRIAEVVETETTLKTEPETESEEQIRARANEAALIFDDVSFGYGEGADAVSNISFKLKRGETLGIIGATGSGKSTLVSLMMRYYDVRSGHIYVDGRDVRHYENADLKGKFGAVFQNDIIFQDTIRENIRFGREISDAEVLLAAETAQGDFVKERGLDYKLAIRGSNLSGGQKQRIYVARALAGNPEYLILDDSSSALDYATDARMREAIHDAYPDTTMVVVAQRVSSVMNADLILVVEDGRIISQGTHDELLRSCEVYREISESQMGTAEDVEQRSDVRKASERKDSAELSAEQKAALLSMAKTHPSFKDVETYEDIVRRVKEEQQKVNKEHTYRASMDVVRKQLDKEKKANANINKGHVLKRLFAYLLKHKALLILAVLLTLLSNGLALIIPELSGKAIDAMDVSKIGAVRMDEVVYYCVLMVVAIVLSCVLSYLLTVIMAHITKKILASMRREMFDRLLDMRVNYFDTHAAGDIISKITYDVSTINTSLSADIVTLTSSLVTVVGSFIMMVRISPVLCLVFAFTIPVSIIYTRWLSGKVRPLFRARSGKLGEMNGVAEEMIGGQRTIKAYNREIHSLNKFQKMNENAVNAYYRAEYMAVFNGPSVMLLANISLTLVTVFGGLMLLNSNLNPGLIGTSVFGITLGQISAFVLYSRRFSGPINESANIIAELQSALAAAERVFRLMDEPVEEKAVEEEVTLSGAKGEVELRHVRFGYVPEKEIIHDLSLKAEPGKVIAIVGPTGAGKTTIINLLMRFYDIDAGEIIVDGVETRNYTRESLRKSFAMVLQDTWLFTGTVFENVAYGREGATLDDVKRVCDAAHVHKFIMRLPNQYDTVLNDEGTNISKGQKQLLTIARAMLLDAHMLILDEATSNVDTRTELRLQRAMLELMKGKTCFIIAHRLSTIRNADDILVVRDGDVVEQGDHETLMAKRGFYHDLYEAQWSKGESL